MKKNILLLNPPGDRLYLRDCYCSTVAKANYYWHPLDLLVQSGILGKNYNITVLDANVLRVKPNDALQQIFNMDLEAILFLIGSLSWNEDLKFIKAIKKQNPSIKLIGSGEVLRFEGQKVMEQFQFIDAILLDFTSDAILNFLDSSKDANKIDNFIYRFNNRIIQGDILNNTTFEIPCPKHERFPLNSYKLPFGKREKFASILTTYGCPYKCTFCNTGTLGFKKRSVDNFMEELEYIANLGINKIFVRDATFGADPQHAQEICTRIIKNNIKIEWNCFSRVDTLDKDLLRLMKKAGCYLIQFGVESGDERVLERYNKHIKVDKILEAFENCRRYKIDTVAHFILGLPGEDSISLAKTINLAKKINTTYASFNIAEPRFGTGLREEYISNNWIDPHLYNYPSKKQLLKLRNFALRDFYLRPAYILNRLLSIHKKSDVITLFENLVYMIKNLRNIY